VIDGAQGRRQLPVIGVVGRAGEELHRRWTCRWLLGRGRIAVRRTRGTLVGRRRPVSTGFFRHGRIVSENENARRPGRASSRGASAEAIATISYPSSRGTRRGT